MNRYTVDVRMVRHLIIKDWQLYQRQLAAYILGLLLALTLIGTGRHWPFYIGALLLMALLICAGGFAIQSSLINERKEQTLPFIMSLPVTPMDLYWGKLLGNTLLFLVPFALVVSGTTLLVLYTPLPDGLLVWSLLIFALLAMNFFLSLCVAIVVESEGWITFTMIALSTLISPYMMGIGSIETIGPTVKGDAVIWSAPALGILGAEGLVIVIALVATSWVQSRKTTFL